MGILGRYVAGEGLDVSLSGVVLTIYAKGSAGQGRVKWLIGA